MWNNELNIYDIISCKYGKAKRTMITAKVIKWKFFFTYIISLNNTYVIIWINKKRWIKNEHTIDRKNRYLFSIYLSSLYNINSVNIEVEKKYRA